MCGVGVEVAEVIDLTVDICGIYQRGCHSSERGSEGRVKWFYVRVMKQADNSSESNRFTKSSHCFSPSP